MAKVLSSITGRFSVVLFYRIFLNLHSFHHLQPLSHHATVRARYRFASHFTVSRFEEELTDERSLTSVRVKPLILARKVIHCLSRYLPGPVGRNAR